MIPRSLSTAHPGHAAISTVFPVAYQLTRVAFPKTARPVVDRFFTQYLSRKALQLEPPGCGLFVPFGQMFLNPTRDSRAAPAPPRRP